MAWCVALWACFTLWQGSIKVISWFSRSDSGQAWVWLVKLNWAFQKFWLFIFPNMFFKLSEICQCDKCYTFSLKLKFWVIVFVDTAIFLKQSFYPQIWSFDHEHNKNKLYYSDAFPVVVDLWTISRNYNFHQSSTRLTRRISVFKGRNAWN